mgnify:CR=1 FL=1
MGLVKNVILVMLSIVLLVTAGSFAYVGYCNTKAHIQTEQDKRKEKIAAERAEKEAKKEAQRKKKQEEKKQEQGKREQKKSEEKKSQNTELLREAQPQEPMTDFIQDEGDEFLQNRKEM